MSMSTSQQTLTKDPVLAEKARILLASQYFVGTQAAARLVEKQQLFLALAGLKPVAEATTGHLAPMPGGWHTVYDDPAAVGAFLDSLGLQHRIRHDEVGTDALVSLDAVLLEKYQQASQRDDAATIGELFGYPATATAAFIANQCMSIEEQERIEQKAWPADDFYPNFGFSQDHWQDELAVCQRWYAALRLYGMLQ